MDYTNERSEMGSSEQWGWQGDDYYLQRDPHLGTDFSPSLWDGVNQNEDDLLHLLEETTPVKACADFDYNVTDSGEWNSVNMEKGSEDCRESSQLKRRRMLQFSSHATDPLLCNEQLPLLCNEQLPSTFVTLKERENSLMEDQLPENMQWIPSFSDEGCTTSNEGPDQSPEGWLVNCFNDNEMHASSEEMNFSGVSDDQVDISEFCNIPPEMESDLIQESVTPTPRSLFKVISARKAFMRTPTKLATPVAYPFALVKPCGVQGDVTLKDINQRIRTPPPSRSKHLKDEDASPSYPTSAFSGKPVVVKTKIFTEGGKGSITITRTKG